MGWFWLWLLFSDSGPREVRLITPKEEERRRRARQQAWNELAGFLSQTPVRVLLIILSVLIMWNGVHAIIGSLGGGGAQQPVGPFSSIVQALEGH